MNSVTFARSSRTDPDENDYGWSDAPPPRSGAGSASDAGPADASDVSGPGDAPDGGAEAADHCNEFGPNHDFDGCVHDMIPNGVLFAQQDGDTDAIDAKDVRQRSLGDCYLFACLGALSQTPDGRALLRNAIVENRNDGGDVTGWTVTLHERESQALSGTTFRAVQVTVDLPYVHGHGDARLAGPGPDSPSEVWPLVIEKAVAKYLGGYNALDRGSGSVSAMMGLLTGHQPTNVCLQWPPPLLGAYGAQQVSSDLAAGKVVVLETPESPSDLTLGESAPFPYGLHGNHAYFVTGVEQHDGQPCLRLGNPWGFHQPNLVPCAELSQWFTRVDVGSVH